MRRWSLPPAGEAVLWRPSLAGRACESFSSPAPPAAGRFPGVPRWRRGQAEAFFPHTTCGGAVPWRPSLAERACGNFPPSHSKTRWTKISSDPVPPGTPKLFSIHSSLFSFPPEARRGRKTKAYPPNFPGTPENCSPQGRFYRICTRFAGIQSLGFFSLIHSELFLIQTERFTVPPLTSGPL